MSAFAVEFYTKCDCGGSVSKKLRPWEEAWDAIDHHLYKCQKCKREDFYEGFSEMELINENLHCPTCEKVTKHRLEYFDYFDGMGETTCLSCKNKVVHQHG